ncbi:MAG TPA: polysaccharide biosynthesis/export family protein [Pyrinomonadaceae bacterium]|nr:polysaccharide biosynthesis/export family protein [Pyrinomonadaceae bacterium]
MRAFIYLCFLCASVFVIAPPTSGQVSDPTSPTTVAQVGKEDRYRIGFQDVLEIQVYRHGDLNQRVSVNSNGTISLFRLKDPVVAACKTEAELADTIEQAYQKDYLKNPEVNVVAIEQRSRAFGVMGAVEKPGQYMISRRVRLLELLAQAGGPNKEAGTRVIVARTGSTSNCTLNEGPGEAPLDDKSYAAYSLKDILEGRENVVMRPGDIVSVLKADIVYVYGNVNEQGLVEMRGPLTLTQAIASAKGTKPATDKSKVRVLRLVPGKAERDEFIYDLKAIESRKANDPFLEPNDVVALSVDKTKDIMNSVGRSLTNGIPSIFYRVP